MHRLFYLILIGCLLLPSEWAFSQTHKPLVMMNLAAHPDDEDGRTMTYYRKAQDAITYSVIYTRGEGGQNEIGPELYEALGAIRTDETERAARILGTQVHFLNFKDFGYSKSAKESFEKWGGEDYVTSRVVYMIRKLKPDVLFTNHDTVTVGPRTQHGHHQVVGISAYNAFELAADPTYHPEQLEEDGVDLWQPSRMFLRLWRFSQDAEADAEVPVNMTHEPAGKSYSEIATDAIAEHASQGMGMFAAFRGMRDNTRFLLYRSSADLEHTPDDLAGNLKPNTAATPDLPYMIDSGRIESLPAGTISLDDDITVAGQLVKASVDASLLPATNVTLTLKGGANATYQLSKGQDQSLTILVDPKAEPSVPAEVYQYNRFTNHPPIIYKATDSDTGEPLAAGYLPLQIAPSLHFSTDVDVARINPNQNVLPVNITLHDPRAKKIKLSLEVREASTGQVVSESQFKLKTKVTELTSNFYFDLPADLSEGDYAIVLKGENNKNSNANGAASLMVPARHFDVQVADGVKVGVIESYDNTLAHALNELGVQPVMIDSVQLASADFAGLHTILVDIRAYLVRQDLRTHNQHLLDWVKDGGNLIVNYQKTFEWNEGSPDPFEPGEQNASMFAPYPIKLSRGRVTLEDAPVEVLVPNHPMFHWPNAIGEAVWDNWVQERGLYFPGEYDEAYQELFSMHDPGEAPLTSSTLIAEYGAGTYMYTALGWYRQLKVYHPEVYALFANMISLPLQEEGPASPE